MILQFTVNKEGEVKDVKVIYPKSGDCEYTVEDGVLKVKMPGDVCARLFEITLE